jgi:disulfide bond formation protein DsbB
LSVVFSFYLLYSWLGRIGFLVYLATFVLGALLSRRPRPFALLAGGCSVMLAIVIGAYYLSPWLNLKPADNLSAFLGRELAFPFGSFFAQLDLDEHLFRAFKDFLVALKIAVLGIFYAQPALVIKGNFALLVTAVVMAIVLKTPRLRWHATRRQVGTERNSGGFTSSTAHSLRRAT